MNIEDGKMYFIQCSSEYAGECLLWWKPDGRGYTTNIDQAGMYLAEDAQRIVDRRQEDCAWEVNTMMSMAKRHVCKESVEEYLNAEKTSSRSLRT